MATPKNEVRTMYAVYWSDRLEVVLPTEHQCEAWMKLLDLWGNPSYSIRKIGVAIAQAD